MKAVLSGALLGTALSILFKTARTRGALPPPTVVRARLRRSARRRRDGADLEALTREELYERARAEGIPGRSGMTKEQLIEALRARSGGG